MSDKLVDVMAAVLNVPASALQADPTHACEWDAVGRVRVPTICGGVYIKRTEHSNHPSCPECAAILAARDDDQTIEETFGPAPVGTQVQIVDFDPTGGRARRIR